MTLTLEARELLTVLRDMVDMFERHIEGLPGPDDAARAAIEKASESQVERNEPAYVDPDGNPHGSMADVRRYFNEAECGGTFDGFNVTSDADPGL